MLSILTNVFEDKDVNGRTFFTCRFRQDIAAIDDNTVSNFKVGGKCILNPVVPAAHDRFVTFNIFINESKASKEIAAALRARCGIADESKINEIALPLVYKEVPVSEIFPGRTEFYVRNAQGALRTRTSFGVTGYSKIAVVKDENGKVIDVKDTDEWDDALMGADLVTFAKNNAYQRFAEGTFLWERPADTQSAASNVDLTTTTKDQAPSLVEAAEDVPF